MSDDANIPHSSKIASLLRQLINRYAIILQLIEANNFSAKPNPAKWSKKEILGHLIDSAQNNLRRFITAQYEVEPPHIIYDQDFWVAVNQYQDVPTDDLIMLWKMLNERIVTVLENLPESKLEQLCNTGKGKIDLHSLSYLATDYLAHTEHHLKQIAS